MLGESWAGSQIFILEENCMDGGSTEECVLADGQIGGSPDR
jgi:hypothetical protein